MSVEKLLKMIETVDPSDTAKLDEIDARVMFFVEPDHHLIKFYNEHPDSDLDAIKHAVAYGHAAKYTRSRDALKAIRPKGYMFRAHRQIGGGTEWELFGRTSDIYFTSPYLNTEELAELHAIIQAVAHERKSGAA